MAAAGFEPANCSALSHNPANHYKKPDSDRTLSIYACYFEDACTSSATLPIEIVT